MNKKIMSFVLAMVLSVGLGVSSLFASTYWGDSVTEGYANQNDNAGPVNASTTTGSNSGGVWIEVGKTGDLLSGNLTAEFRYYAGIMTGYEQAGGKFIISDSYTSMKAMLSNANDDWTVEFYAFTQSDLASMPDISKYVEDKDGDGEPDTKTTITDENGKEISAEKYNSLSDEEKAKYTIKTNYVFKKGKEAQFVKDMEAWLKERGWSDEQLRVAKTNDQGEVVKDKNGKVEYESLSADFYVQLRSELAKGLNYSASLQSGTGVTGPTATVLRDGQNLYTFISVNSKSDAPAGYPKPSKVEDGKNVPTGIRVTSETDYYDAGPFKGLVKGTKTYALVATGETRTGDDGKEYEKYEWRMNYSYSTYEEKTDKNGAKYYVRTDFTASGLAVNSTDKQINAAVQAIIKDYNNGDPINSSDLAKGKGGYTVTQYTVNTYTNNATLVKQYNSQTQNTTYFKDGQYATMVKNSSGTTTSWYHYTDNNIMVDILNLTGVGADSSSAYETTVCDQWGTVVGVMNGDYTGEYHQAALDEIKKVKDQIGRGDVVNLSSGTTVKSIYLTSKDLREAIANGNIDNYKFYFGWTDADVQNMLNFDYGDGVVAMVTLKFTEQFSNSTNSDGEAAVTASGAKIRTQRTSTSAGTHTYHQTLGDSVSYSGWTFDSTIMIGGANAYSKTQDVIVSGNRTITVESDPAVTGELYPSDADVEEYLKNLTDEEKAAMEKAGCKADKKGVKKYLQYKKAKELGVGHFDKDGKFVVDDKENWKNLKEGFYYDKDTKKTYAILSVSSIYLMDGSDEFQPVSGETILVDLGTTTKAEGAVKKKEIQDAMKGTDGKIMFMGTAGFGKEKGHLVLNMKTEWSKGYVANKVDEDGKSAIDTVKEQIIEVSKEVYSAIMDLKEGKITQAQYDKKIAKIQANAEKKGYGWVVNNAEDNVNKFLEEFGDKLKGQFPWDKKGTKLEKVWEVLNIVF